MKETIAIPLTSYSQENEIILYQPDSTVKLEVRLEREEEFVEASVHSILEYAAAEGKSYKTNFYNSNGYQTDYLYRVFCNNGICRHYHYLGAAMGLS